MCGIIGGISTKANWDKDKMLALIEHRGPDSKGCFEEGNIFLGHARLSIQDLSENGRQPLFSQDERYVIVFNGEIYNHIEIRNKLTAEFDFKSHSDTETILYAYIKYGEKCLTMFNGIFAFAIYDRHTKEIFIARDHFGVKPLYIYAEENSFLFSSELKAFLAFDIEKSLQKEAFANYLTFLWSPGDITPFKHVSKLLPGHYMHFSINNLIEAKPIKYYQIPFDGAYLNNTENELIDLLEEKLIKAVERQMLSDVPIGFFLSGGLDSSLIVAIAKKLFPDKKFPCFTIDTGESHKKEGFAYDLEYAKKVAAKLDVELFVVKADIDIVSDFDKMVWHLDEPQADPAPLNVLNIAKFAREKGIKVLLGGTGGDDIFSGYRRHQALKFENTFKLLPRQSGWLIKKMLQLFSSEKPIFRRLKKLAANIDKKQEKRLSGYFSWLDEGILNSLFSEKWKTALAGFTPTDYLEKLNLDIPNEKNLLNRMLYWEMKSFLVDHNFNYTDKMAMAVGVEARVPFLDVELLEFSTKIPPELKLKGGETKYILKKVAERYLDKEIIYRPKTGFGAPIRKWIINDMNDMINERLSIDNIQKRGIFNAEKVWELIEMNKKGKIDASYSIWTLLAIESWMEQFSDETNRIKH